MASPLEFTHLLPLKVRLELRRLNEFNRGTAYHLLGLCPCKNCIRDGRKNIGNSKKPSLQCVLIILVKQVV